MTTKMKRASRARKFQVGDVVQYTAQFCRNIGAQTGDTPFLRGTVTAVKEYTSRSCAGTPDKITVKWAFGFCGPEEEDTWNVLACNLMCQDEYELP
jgi:hypothetical protein